MGEPNAGCSVKVAVTVSPAVAVKFGKETDVLPASEALVAGVVLGEVTKVPPVKLPVKTGASFVQMTFTST
jgi:hypothetical protein